MSKERKNFASGRHRDSKNFNNANRYDELRVEKIVTNGKKPGIDCFGPKLDKILANIKDESLVNATYVQRQPIDKICDEQEPSQELYPVETQNSIGFIVGVEESPEYTEYRLSQTLWNTYKAVHEIFHADKSDIEEQEMTIEKSLPLFPSSQEGAEPNEVEWLDSNYMQPSGVVDKRFMRHNSSPGLEEDPGEGIDVSAVIENESRNSTPIPSSGVVAQKFVVDDGFELPRIELGESPTGYDV